MNTPPLKYCPGFPVLTILFSGWLLMVSGLATPLPPIQAVRWETDLNAAMTRAEQEQRPLFLHFIGHDGSSAQQMGTEIFSQPNIAAHLNANFVMVRINAIENPGLAQRFTVTAIPTDLILKPNGQLIHRRVGAITAERFTQYLAYLQDMIQTERNQNPTPPPATGSLSLVNPLGAAHPVPSSAAAPPATAIPPVTAVAPVVVPQQPESNVAVPGAVRDPFLQSSTPVAPLQRPPMVTETMAAGASPSLSANNPLRTQETAAKPAWEPIISTPDTSAPPVTVSATASAQTVPVQTVPAQAVSEEPAPAKMMVEVPLALEGYCPVMLCKEERWVSGNPAYCTLYQGHIFRFSSLEALMTFAQDPANYTPVAMGEDVVLRIDRNRRVNGDRNFGAWFEGRVFLFSCQETFNAFETRPSYYAEIALKYEVARREQPAPIVY